MNFSDMQTAVLYRLRQQGGQFGTPPSNPANAFMPPYEISLFLNMGYNDFLSKTMDFPLAAVVCTFPTAATVMSYPLTPIPPNGLTINPAAMKVYEFLYVQQGSYQRYIPIVSTKEFRQKTGGYQLRFGVYSSWPYFVSQLWGQRVLQLYPGTANITDQIIMTICPDPMATGTTCTAALGGILAAPTDVPLFPSQFHEALIEFAVAKLSEQADKQDQRDFAEKKYLELVNDAMMFGRTTGEGATEQMVESWWFIDQ